MENQLTIKVFISQPMRGLTDEEIKARREKDIEQIKKRLAGEKLEFIDSFTEEYTRAKNSPIAYLGHSIIKLAEADMIAMSVGYDQARGCMIEHQIAKEYGIPVIYLG